MKIIALFLCVASVAFAATMDVNLSGNVTNKAGQPIAGAIVSLPSQSMKDTTSSSGTFQISNLPVSLNPQGSNVLEGISLERGVLEIRQIQQKSFLLEIYDLGGRLVKRVADPKINGGSYRLHVGDLASGNTSLYFKISMGNQVRSFYALPSSKRSLALQSVVLVVDTLEVSAEGFQLKKTGLTTLKQTAESEKLTIVLDSAIKSTGSVGCGKTPSLVNGTRTVQSGGQSRQYILDIPSNYDKSHAYKLVFGFHWSGSNMTDVATGQTVARDKWAYYGLKALANNSTIFIAPQGIDAGWANTNGRDLVFTDDILNQVKTDLCIDTTRIFSVGFSYGGGMGYALACDRPDVFRAVAVQSGAQLSGCVEGKKPIAYFGASSLTETMGRGLGQKMAERNGCTAQEIPLPAAGSNSHICIQYQGCNDGYPVEWCTHTSGHQAAPYDGGAGDNADKTWVPGKVWSFFSQF